MLPRVRDSIPKILKEEILKAEDKDFFQYVLDHQCVPNVVEVEEEEGDGGWQDGGIAQGGCITHGDKRLEVRVFSSTPAGGLAALPPATIAARNAAASAQGARERAAEDSVQPDHQLVVVSKRQREHQEQPAKATAVEDAVSSFVNDKGQVTLAQGELLAVLIGDPGSDGWPLAIAEYRAVAAEQASDVPQDEVYGPCE